MYVCMRVCMCAYVCVLCVYVCVCVVCVCVCVCVGGGAVTVDLQVVGQETHCVLGTWWLVAVLLWLVYSFRMMWLMTAALSLIVWWRPD